jgi:hypothetical protein
MADAAISISVIAASVYLTIAGLLVTRMLIGLALTWRIWWRARPAPGSWTGGMLRVRISDSIVAPVTVGSAVLIPTGFCDWPPMQRRAVLLHERSHAANGDFYVQVLAALDCDFLVHSARLVASGAADCVGRNHQRRCGHRGPGRSRGLRRNPGRDRKYGTVPNGGRGDGAPLRSRTPDRANPVRDRFAQGSVPVDALARRDGLPAVIACASPAIEPPANPSLNTSLAIADFMVGTIDGRTLPRDTSVSVINWMAGVNRIFKERNQQLGTLRDRQSSLAEQDGRLRSKMATESSRQVLDQLTKQEGDILAQQEELGRNIGELEDPKAIAEIVQHEGYTSWPPKG